MLIVFFLLEQFKISLVNFMNRDDIVCIFQVNGAKITILCDKVKCTSIDSSLQCFNFKI